MNRESAKPMPWWLQAGSEECESCQGSYQYEAGYVCARCDKQLCPCCALVERLVEVVCLDCHEGND